jgi:SNF2 domain-containing protein/helicase-like protein
MLELEKGAMANHRLPAWARKKIAEAQKRRWQKIRGTSNQPPRDPQPPRVAKPLRSTLREKLVKNIGRELQDDEARFVLQVQRCFADARIRMFTENDLGLMAGRASDGYWTAVDLWREFPPDDFYFWLYVAWELRRRDWKYPQFIAGITDFQLIEPAMKQWEREKEIEQWNNRFRQFDNHAPVSGTDALELRLTIGAEEARLQWRSEANAGFAELERVRAGNIAEQCEKGTLAIAPNSLPLWSAAYRPWRSESWWFFRYDSATARPGLNCLLRMPLAPDRVVTSDSQPLRRVAQPLRFNLRAPENVDGDYELALGTADGSSPPKILCALDGRPTLYLTEGGLFVGPPAVLDAELRKNIPAPALETAAGLEFLHAAGIALPEHLSERIRTVPVRVTISCALKPTYPASPTEDIVLRAAAKAPGMKSERYAPAGWEVERKDNAGDNSESAKGVIVVHDRAAQLYFPRAIESLELKWSNDPGEWTFRLTKKTPERFVAWLESLPPEIEVLLDPELATLRDAPVSGNVSLDVDEAGIDWFDLRVALQVSDTTLTPQELKLLLNARGGYVRLEKKGWRRLQFSLTPDDYEQLARLGLDARDFSAEPQRFHTLQLAEDAAKTFLAPERVETIQRRASELKTRVAPPLPAVIRAEMRPYQTEGFHFLAYLASNRFGGVLADDMGLGKTLEALAWLAWLRETTLNAQPSTPNSSLVVCPKSVMDNWHAEANRFYPDLRVRLWRGEPGSELSAARENCDLLVINYTQLRYLSPEIASAPWLAAILDEAQYIKNPSSQTAQAARVLKAEHRLALTGTPIENRLQDLWSVFAFAMPGALGNRTHFLRRFDSKDDPLARRRLAARVRPFLLRRTKAQVEKDLPDRVEEDLLCEMEGEQKTLYRAELKRARQLILGLKTDEQLNQERFHVLTSLLRLRQICCHPALVDANLRQAESAKVSALEDLLEPLLEEGHKVLVFSQFVTMLDLLRENVKQRGWPHFYLAGETENRGELVRKFQSAKDGAVFLISLKAGGFGLNLTAASYVVLFDPWWNPAVENQAIDRTHRIGQTSKVMAYRLLMRDSVEQKIRALQKQKAALADDVLGEERFAQSLTLEDLQFLFAEGTRDSNESVREFTDCDFHLGQRVGRSSSQNRKPAAEPCGNGDSTGVCSDDRGV